VQVFPLAVSSNGRYLQQADGTPFLIHGDTPWSLMVQFSDASGVAYIEDTAAKGFTAILFNFKEHNFSMQSPAYENVDGDPPLVTMTNYGSGINANYGARGDLFYDTCIANNIVPCINPAYLGISGSEEGWDTEVAAESDADLQAYGAALATRYPFAIWVMGGDADPAGALLAKQWQIVVGIRSVDPNAIITAHGAPGSPSFDTWEGETGYNVHTAYPGAALEVSAACLTEYGRSPTRPVIMLEGIYEQERDPVISAAGLRRQSYQGLLSGACGQFFGNNPIWHGGCTVPPAFFDYTGDVSSNLNSTGRQHQAFVAALFQAYAWHLLEPKTDTSLVSSSLSSGNTRVCPALASDGSFAMIWVPSSQTVTVVTNALSGVAGNVRIRLFNPTDGTYSVNQASVAKSSGQSVATGGERVIVVDAA
jgi:hypothetical protein